MFIKLNFQTAQPPSIWFDSIYWILNNLTSNLNWVANNNFKISTGTVNATTFANSIKAPGSSASQALQAVINSSTGFDPANSEIIYTTSDIMPVVYYYSGSSPTPSLTIKSLIYDTNNTYSFLQITPTTFTHATAATSFTTNTTSSSSTITLTNPSASQTWSTGGNSYCFWAYISPTTFTWAASNPTVQTRSGWHMKYETAQSDWIAGNIRQFGPFMSSQYTRLDVWNTDANGIVPVTWINGRDATYRPYYGLNYWNDIGWKDTTNYSPLVNLYNYNPKASPTSSTTFSVMNTLDATANSTGVWNLYGAPTVNNGAFLSSTLTPGQKVGFGTNIRGFQDQASLAASTNGSTGSTLNYNSSTYPSATKTSLTDTAISRSAWHGLQSASIYGPDVIEYNATASSKSLFFRWPSSAANPLGTYVLHPIVWNRADYNNIGGLISDKSGVYLFNGDYTAGDEFSVSGITYSIWPLADGWGYRVGLAVPKR